MMSEERISLSPASLAVNEAAVFRRVSWRLLPFLFLLYVINLIDRGNIGIARLQMVDELKLLDEKAYALGAGIFYIGYLLFEVPSNLILLRLGARVWIARILISWGLISAAMMFVSGPWSFAILRMLLGVAEAGFFPGIIYYLSDWFPARVRAGSVALFMMGGVISSMVGNPLSGFILDGMNQVGGLWDWQWIFLLEGIPAVVLGLVTLFYLTDRPAQAHWLTPAERTWLSQQIENDHQDQPHRRRAGSAGVSPANSAGGTPALHHHSLAAAALDLRVWLLIAVYFTVAMGDNSYGFYIPTFLKSQFPDWSAWKIGLLAAAPSVIALIGMVLVGKHSDRTGERRWHVAGSAFAAALGWLLIALVVSRQLTIPGLDSRWLFVAGVALALTGMKSMLPTFWTLPPSFLRGAAAAGGIALINSIANLGGMLGPTIVGFVKAASGSFTIGYLVLAQALFLGGVLVLNVTQEGPRRRV